MKAVILASGLGVQSSEESHLKLKSTRLGLAKPKAC